MKPSRALSGSWAQKYLLSTYYVTCIVLGAEDKMRETDNVSMFMEFIVQWRM